MNRIIAYVTGAVALTVVVTSVGSALLYATFHSGETLQNLSVSTLQGVGVAIGGCLGGALMLRYKAARTFIKHLIQDLKDDVK